MIDETDRLDRFVANLLSMSRIEAGTLRADMQPVDVTELLERVTHRFERSGRARSSSTRQSTCRSCAAITPSSNRS